MAVVLAGCKTPAPTSLSPRLAEPLKFNDFTVCNLNQEGVSNLLTAKVYIGIEQPDSSDYDIFMDGTNSIHVETVEQYRQIKNTKAYAPTTADMVMQDWFEQADDVLEFMEKAKTSTNSFLGPNFLKDLPVTILESGFVAVEGDFADKYGKILEADTKAGKTIQNYTSSSAPLPLKNLKQSGHTLTFFDRTIEIDYYIKELVRGDVNGDGVEDALVSIGWHTQGTMGGAWNCVVTRTANQKQLRILNSSPNEVLKYEPAEVELAGTISKETFPGAPNYESVAKGDAPEDYWILNLDKPVDVAGLDEMSPAETNLQKLQLVLGEGDYEKYRPFLNRPVVVKGTLFHQVTVHHKTPVLIEVKQIELPK